MFCVWVKCGCELRNTHTWDAEADEMNEMK